MRLALLVVVAGMLSMPASAEQNQISDAVGGQQLPKEALVAVNGVTLHYLDWGGNGDVVLLLGGLGNDAQIFDGFAQKLTDRWRVIGLTRRGFGKSSKLAEQYTTAARVEDMRQFFHALKIPRAHLIGHSLAGDEMTLFASLYPELAGSLVYLDAAYDRSGSLEMGLSDPPSSALNRRLILEAIKPSEANTVPLPSRNTLPPDVLRIMVAYVKEMNDFHVDFSKVQSRILALYAISDRHPNTPAQSTDDAREKADGWWIEEFRPWQQARIREFRRQQPNAAVVEMATTNHFLFLGKTQDEVLGHIRGLLSR